MRYSNCMTCYRSVGWIGLVTNTVLMFMKGFVGLISGSQALVADAMYSAKDIVTSLLVIVGVNVSSQPLDRDHPYGHGKIEFVLTLVISVIFIAVTGYLFVHAIQVLLDESLHRTPHLIALWAALLSIAVNIGMYYYARCVSIEANSPMIRTLAKHHHADATSSGAVALGIIGATFLGMPWIDTLIALFETMHLLYLSGDLFWESYRGLMDRSVARPVREKMLRVARETEGVSEVRELRTRYIGQELHAEIVIRVRPEITIEEAHAIGTRVKERLGAAIAHLGSAQVKFEAEGDTTMETAQSVRGIRELPGQASDAEALG